MRQLFDLLGDLEDLDDELVIYAQVEPDWNCLSLVKVYSPPVTGDLPNVIAGMKYLLEVGTAKEVVRVWKAWRGGREPSPEEKCLAVIYYAGNDSYLPVDR